VKLLTGDGDDHGNILCLQMSGKGVLLGVSFPSSLWRLFSMRKPVSLLWIIFVLAFAGVASADSLTYTVMGYGGSSPAVTGVSQNPFYWAASDAPSATVSGSVLTTYGFDPLSGAVRGVTPAPYSHNDLYTGSLLLSTPFTVNGAQGLTVNFAEVTAAGFDYGNFEFAVLLQNSQTAAILGLVAPVVPGAVTDEPYAGTVLTPVSPGVQVTTHYYNAGYPGTFQLGSTEFGQFTGNNTNLYCSNSPCQGLFTSSYTPTAGSYQLLFGSFGNGNNFPAAVAVESVSVPEGDSLGYVVAGFMVILLLRRRTHLVKPQP
jgi:hypothetical protein